MAFKVKIFALNLMQYNPTNVCVCVCAYSIYNENVVFFSFCLPIFTNILTSHKMKKKELLLIIIR